MQDYDAMVSLVEEMALVSHGSLTSSVTVQYWYSFALNRCYIRISVLFPFIIVLMASESQCKVSKCLFHQESSCG